MASGSFVLYFRVSTDRQGASGLGIEAQRASVAAFLNGGDWKAVGEFVEVESGKRNDRAELAKAIRACRLYGAKLLIAKLDRLSRDAHFLLGLEKAGVDFIAADMPTANRLTVGIMAMVAEEERRMISARTKAALAQKAKFYAGLDEDGRAALQARGKAVQLGGYRGGKVDDAARMASAVVRKAAASDRAADVLPTIAALQSEGVTTLAALAAALTARGIPTARGAAVWSSMQVYRVLKAA